MSGLSCLQIIVKSQNGKDQVFVVSKSGVVDVTEFLRGSVVYDKATNEKRIQLAIERWK